MRNRVLATTVLSDPIVDLMAIPQPSAPYRSHIAIDSWSVCCQQFTKFSDLDFSKYEAGSGDFFDSRLNSLSVRRPSRGSPNRSTRLNHNVLDTRRSTNLAKSIYRQSTASSPGVTQFGCGWKAKTQSTALLGAVGRAYDRSLAPVSCARFPSLVEQKGAGVRSYPTNWRQIGRAHV